MAVIMDDTYHSLMMDYAAGTLDEVYALVIATHLALSPKARNMVSQYEGIGGGLLHDCCAPVAMKETALRSVLDRLDTCAETKSERPCTEEEIKCAEMKAMPSCLRVYMEPENDHLPWKTIHTGLRTITVKTSCCQSRAELMKIEAGATIPRHAHKGYEIILILDGVIEEGPQIFVRGDLAIREETIDKNRVAGDETGCLFLTVTTAPSMLHRFLGALLNPFIR